MSSSSHEGFITSLSPIACNNRRSRKYGFLAVIARQLSRSDNARLYADPRSGYGPPCVLQLLHLSPLSPLDIPRGNGISARAGCPAKNFCGETFASRDVPWSTILRAAPRDFLKFRAPILLSIYYVTLHGKFSETLAAENNIYAICWKILPSYWRIQYSSPSPRSIYFILITWDKAKRCF